MTGAHRSRRRSLRSGGRVAREVHCARSVKKLTRWRCRSVLPSVVRTSRPRFRDIRQLVEWRTNGRDVSFSVSTRRDAAELKPSRRVRLARVERLAPARQTPTNQANLRTLVHIPSRNARATPLQKSSTTPTVVTVDRSSAGTSGAPLVPVDERAPTSLELLRQLEGFVREHFNISADT